MSTPSTVDSSSEKAEETLAQRLSKISHEKLAQEVISVWDEVMKMEQELAISRQRTRALELELASLDMEQGDTVSISDLEEQLNLKIGTLGELFGVVRQLSGDAKSNFNQSLTNLEFPDRIAFLGDLAERKALPTVSELNALWYELLNEMNASGKVSKFNYSVLNLSLIHI